MKFINLNSNQLIKLIVLIQISLFLNSTLCIDVHKNNRLSARSKSNLRNKESAETTKATSSTADNKNTTTDGQPSTALVIKGLNGNLETENKNQDAIKKLSEEKTTLYPSASNKGRGDVNPGIQVAVSPSGNSKTPEAIVAVGKEVSKEALELAKAKGADIYHATEIKGQQSPDNKIDDHKVIVTGPLHGSADIANPTNPVGSIGQQNKGRK